MLEQTFKQPKLIPAQDVEQKARKIDKLNPVKNTKSFVAAALYELHKNHILQQLLSLTH